MRTGLILRWVRKRIISSLKIKKILRGNNVGREKDFKLFKNLIFSLFERINFQVQPDSAVDANQFLSAFGYHKEPEGYKAIVTDIAVVLDESQHI